MHSANIEVVDDRKEYPNCDALILNQKNKAIYFWKFVTFFLIRRLINCKIDLQKDYWRI